MKLGILNTSITTEDGIYVLETISLEKAKEIISTYTDSDLDSAIGHDATAQILSELLGREIAVNRQQFAQQQCQPALVFKLNGRAPEGVILSRDEIEAIGYSFKLMTRLADRNYDVIN